VNKFGAEKLFQVLGIEDRESDQRRADAYRPPSDDDEPESLPGDNDGESNEEDNPPEVDVNE